MVGMLLTAVFAHSNVNPAVTDNGLFFGETALFTAHLLALIGASLFAFFGSLLLLKVTDLIAPLRVSEEQELVGLDVSQHDEVL
jgi:Amt family ammonium transporter